MPPPSLDVHLYGTHTAVLTPDSRGRIRMEWTTAALDRWGARSRVVGNLLPVGEVVHPLRVTTFLDGYLPEGRARVHHAIEAGVENDDTFGLIGVYGRDLAGALVVVPSGTGPAPPDPRYEPIDTDEVRRRLEKASRHTGRLDARDSFSSLPGMVPKVLLHRDGGQWFACRGGAPSTWIVKRGHDPGSPAEDVIDTEVLALRCATRIGLGSVTAEVLDLGGLRAIAVSRYDRRPNGSGGFGRVHQEDLAQAIGLNTDDANRKYQRGESRMPSLRHASEVLETSGADPDPLLSMTTFGLAVGNTDMHAKNVSFLRSPRARARLAPAYDVAMHLHAVENDGQFALQVNGKNDIADIDVADLIAEGCSWGLPADRAVGAVRSTLTDLEAALRAERAESAHAGVREIAWSTVLERVEHLRRDLASSA